MHTVQPQPFSLLWGAQTPNKCSTVDKLGIDPNNKRFLFQVISEFLWKKLMFCLANDLESSHKPAVSKCTFLIHEEGWGTSLCPVHFNILLIFERVLGYRKAKDWTVVVATIDQIIIYEFN